MDPSLSVDYSPETHSAKFPIIGPDEAALYVQGLSKTFGRGDSAVHAVKDISFAVEPGEILGLLGPNGAGKTTLIKTVLGLILPDEGEVRIQGIDVYEQPGKAYEHLDAMLEGVRNNYWRLTVRENLRYFAAIQGQNPAAVADRHEALLEYLNLADKADTEVRELSRGMKQKVSLASVLAGDVSIAFVDEPTLGLDVESSLKIRREIVRLVKEQALTLLLSSHDMDVIEAICDRVIIMDEGQIIVNNTVQNLLNGFETKSYRITARNIDMSTLSDLHERFNITSVAHVNGHVQFEAAVDLTGFYRLTDVMERHRLELMTVETVQPELAEAFVELTRGASE